MSSIAIGMLSLESCPIIRVRAQLFIPARTHHAIFALSQVEVRDVASTTLSGMVRCGLVGDELLSRCVALSDTRIRMAKRRRSGSSASEPDAPLSEEEKRAIVLRHAGILGVQAYIAGCV